MEKKYDEIKKVLIELLDTNEMPKNEILKILKEYNIKKKNYETVLEIFEDAGIIIKTRGGNYALPKNLGYIEGVLSLNKSNFGFVDLENDEPGIFIAGPNLKSALNGDTVLIKIIKDAKNGKRREGEVIKVTNRSSNLIIGIYSSNTNFGFVKSKNMFKDVYIPKKLSAGARDGQLVAVKLDFWGDEQRKPEGKVVSVLGDPKDTKAIINSLVLASGVEEKFSKDVITYVENIKSIDFEKELSYRKDLRNLDIITIDGSDAKDLDDAVFVEKHENGDYTLIVSIADVAYFVKENTILNEDAQNRGNSVYLVDRVIPMLPRKLSNNLCSLNPNEDKLTFSVEITYDKNGKILKNDFYKSVINSKYRMTYDKVNEILDEKELSNENKDYSSILNMLFNMKELSHKLRNIKKRRGAIEFELPEIKAKLGTDGKISELVLRDRGESERIIEDFMVAANESVAEKLFWGEIPTIYRIHEEPDSEKIVALNESLSKLGYYINNATSDLHPGKFQAIIEKTMDLPEGYLIHKLILRAMQRARYANKNLGHFGLSSNYYLHFTSPIRRFSDLIVHRMLEKSITSYVNPNSAKKYSESFNTISTHISKTERVADKLEDDSLKVKLVEYMQDKIGNTYIARISGMMKNTIFMELENHVEIVYHPNDNKDNFIYDTEALKLINRKTNEEFTIGNTLKVTIANASFDKMEIEVVIDDKLNIRGE